MDSISSAIRRSADSGSSLPQIDFARIRAHAGSQRNGFEELCVQIFRRDCRSEGELHRVEGTGGDEGVEAYVVRPDKSEIGLQSKWFVGIRPAQWRQIDKSVRTALKKHPRLSEYRIAVPLDLTPAQIKAWSGWQQKWRKLTKHPIRFIWLGKSEVSDLLCQAGYRELLVYWFGTPQFTAEWMDGVIHSSIQNLDRRYSPKHHVDTDAGKLADVFAWSPDFTNLMKGMLVDLVDNWRSYEGALAREPLSATGDAERPALVFTMGRLLKSEMPSVGGRPVAALLADVDAALAKWHKVHEELDGIERKAKPVDASCNSGGPSDDRHRYFLMASDRFGRRIRKWHERLHQSVLADKQRLLVLGDAGTGKSHLMASVVVHARKRGQPALLLLGEHFTATDEPWSQVLRVIGWTGNLESLLAALNQAGMLANAPALICIDALNESNDRNLWASHLNAFAAKMQGYPFVRLIVSCRSDFKEITLPRPLGEGRDNAWATIRHDGFGEELFEAVANYFAGYGVKTSHFPPLIEEFRNPLFLRLVCEAFENQRIPDGPLSLERVMSARIYALTAKLQQDIDCSAEDVKAAIYAVGDMIRNNGGRAIDREAARTAVNQFSPDKKHSRSLYTHLRSNGILVETIEGPLTANPAVMVRFAFERFSDYFIAAGLLNKFTTREELISAWRKGGPFTWLLDRGSFWRNRGLLSALAILLPERYQTELPDLVTSPDLQTDVLDDFLASLPWRSAASFTNRSHNVLRRSQRVGISMFLQALLRLSTIPDHPYNADFLHGFLLKMPLQTRELLWTIPIANLAADDASVPGMILTWAMRVSPNLVSDEQALLVSRVLGWFFTNNRRAFRKRATVAAIRILERRADVAAQMIRDFDKVNDPYVVERAYAVACGVAMREPAGPGLRELATVVHKRVFARKVVRPNVLLRDYAQAVLEVAAQRDVLPRGVAPRSFRPPFRSKWPKIWTERQVQRIEQDNGWNRIVYSVRPEAMGMYGDFGRYVMESMVHRFSNVRKTQPLPVSGRRHDFDGRTARRWVLQRVKKLGWGPQRFAEYERNLPYVGRHDDDGFKVERISKKYQWIALHELLGYLCDHYRMRPGWNGEPPKPFAGAWQIGARDLDPSLPLNEFQGDELATGTDVDASRDSYPDPFADPRLCANRVEWVCTKPAEFRPLVLYPHLVHGSASDWVALDGFWDWREPEYQVHRLAVPGRLRMWMHLRSWLVNNDNLAKFVSRVRGIHFWGHGCHGVSLGDGWIGEYPWSRVFSETTARCAEPDEWIENVTIQHTRTTCCWEDRGGFTVPSPQLCEILPLFWSGTDARFLGADTQLAAFQTGKLYASSNGPCVVRLEYLRAALRRARLAIVWAFVGERHCSDEPGFVGDKFAQFSGIYTLKDGETSGGLTRHVIVQTHRWTR